MTSICIVHAGDLSEPSGGTDRVSAFATGLADRGADVVLVTPEPRDALPSRLDPIELETVSVGTRGVIDQPLRAIRISRRARQVAADRGAHLQIEHATLAGAADLFGASGYVLDMHDLSFRSPLYGDLPLGSAMQMAIRYLEGRALSGAVETVVVSERMADFAVDEWNLPHDQFTVIPNGYFPEAVEPYVDVDTVSGRVVFLGTLHPKVDVDALASIAQSSAVEECVVIGDGERRGDLEERAERIGALRVTGRLPDHEAFPLVASAEIAVNPQRASDLQVASSPVKLNYYAALGLPMVLTDGPELAAQFAEAGAAKLVPPEGRFVECVETLLGDRGERKRMSSAARNLGHERTWDRRVSELAEVYDL